MKYVPLVFTITAVFVACKKKDKCEAGAGGSVTIVAYPKHHGVSVRPYSAHIKYNTKDFPGVGPSSYDKTIDADTTENHIEIEDLKCGDYYIYMTGYDTAGAEMVKGGIPYTLSEDASGEVNVDVPVTE